MKMAQASEKNYYSINWKLNWMGANWEEEKIVEASSNVSKNVTLEENKKIPPTFIRTMGCALTRIAEIIPEIFLLFIKHEHISAWFSIVLYAYEIGQVEVPFSPFFSCFKQKNAKIIIRLSVLHPFSL